MLLFFFFLSLLQMFLTKMIYKEKHPINRLLCLSCLMFLTFVLFSIEGSEKGHLRGNIDNVGQMMVERIAGSVSTHKPHINCPWKREDYQRNQSPSSPSSSLDEEKLMRLRFFFFATRLRSNMTAILRGPSTYKYPQYPSNLVQSSSL